MEIDIDTQQDNKQFKKDFYNFFTSHTKNKLLDAKEMLLTKDYNSDMLYLFNSQLFVLNFSTYDIIKKISYSDRVKIEDHDRILSLGNAYHTFIMIYGKSSIYLFPLAANLKETKSEIIDGIYLEQKFSFLKENEEIIKIHYLSNEVRINNLILS